MPERACGFNSHLVHGSWDQAAQVSGLRPRVKQHDVHSGGHNRGLGAKVGGSRFRTF